MTKITKTRQSQIRKSGTKTVWVDNGPAEVEPMTEEQYRNFVDAASWFRRLGGSCTQTRAYTSCGYFVVRDVNTSPDRQQRTITTFEFEWTVTP